MSIVSLTGVGKSYGASVVLRSADLTVSEGERIGVVGRNGAGKSTLARILAGVEAPDTGTATRRRGASVLYLDQTPTFDGDPTAEEAVAAGLAAWSDATRRHEALTALIEAGTGDLEAAIHEQHDLAEAVERLGGWEQSHRVAAVLGKLGIDEPAARVANMSGGEQRRVALARTLIARPDLTVLDEPTNHLDAETIEWLEQSFLDESRGALVLITHDRYLLDRVATRTIEVADGEVHSYDGGYELYLEQKAERLAHVARTERNRQNLLRRELDWLRRQPKARTTKQKARIDRAETALAIEAPTAERTAQLALEVTRSGKTIVECRDLDVSLGGKTLVRGLTLHMTQGERIGIVGRNGTGKTTLLRTLLGELEPTAGTVTIGKNTNPAYFDQLRTGIDEAATVYDNVVGDSPRIVVGDRTLEPQAYLERFALEGHRSRQPVGSLSGGERARVSLARLLRRSTNLLVLDEPTNDLDVDTLAALEEMLVDFGVTALIVTHDRWFLDRVATSILAFEGEGRVTRYVGNFSTYRRLSQAAAEAGRTRADAPTEAPRTSSDGGSASDNRARRGLSFRERRELDGLLDAIDAAEARVTELTASLADPDTYASRGSEIATLSEALEAARLEAERLTARWEELELKQSG